VRNLGIIVLILVSALITEQLNQNEVAINWVDNLRREIQRLETSEATGVASHITLKTPFAHDGDFDSHAERFFTEFPVFGVREYSNQLQFIKNTRDPHFANRFSAFFEQRHKGVKVFGSGIRVHLNEDRHITSADGIFIPDLEGLDMTYVITKEEAKEIALKYFKSRFNGVAAIIDDIQPMIYREGLFAGRKGNNYATWMCVVTDQMMRRDQIFVQAQTGEVLISIPLVHSIHREAWQGEYQVGSPFWVEGDPFPTNSSEANLDLNVSLAVYTAFQNAFNYTSYDNKDSKMITVFDLVDNSTNCPNAFWNGTLFAACPGVSAVDVVAHEWGHAYDQFTADLIYQGQSGAMNEAFADIVGETIQELFFKSYPLRNESCGSGLRWIIGEDLNVTGLAGGIRDMYNPNCFQDPRFVNDTNFVYCGTEDNGGVHKNSGIVNQLYSLSVDGGTLNGVNVTGVGFLKGFHIYMRTLMVTLQSAATFSTLATGLSTSCSDLIGVNLIDPVTGNSTNTTISALDCTSIDDAINATQLTSPFCANVATNTTAPPVVFYAFPPIGEVGNFSTTVYFLSYPTQINTLNATCKMVETNGTVFIVNATLQTFEFFFLYSCPVITSNTVGETLNITVSTDGVHYSAFNLLFSFRPKINVTSISPTSGPAGGGTTVTVFGGNFELFTGCQPFPTRDVNGNLYDCLTCLFGNVTTEQPVAAHFINNSTVTCIAPSFFNLVAPQVNVLVWVSKNAQLFTSSTTANFTYLLPATSNTQTPTITPTISGTASSTNTPFMTVTASPSNFPVSASSSSAPRSITRPPSQSSSRTRSPVHPSRSSSRTRSPVHPSQSPSHSKTRSRSRSPEQSSASFISPSFPLLCFVSFALFLTVNFF